MKISYLISKINYLLFMNLFDYIKCQITRANPKFNFSDRPCQPFDNTFKLLCQTSYSNSGVINSSKLCRF
jgi:hypothetical protein